jgi:hypothetical protein
VSVCIDEEQTTIERKEVVMVLTMWMDVASGKQLEEGEVETLRRRAKVVYAANTQLFEDEFEAFEALGVVPILANGRLAPRCLRRRLAS